MAMEFAETTAIAVDDSCIGLRVVQEFFVYAG